MGREKEGGPAFPTIEFYDEKPVGMDPGMTLRDHFAGQALAGFVQFWGNSDTAEIAKRAYEAADAMLEARKK